MSYVMGYHVCKDRWTPVKGKTLKTVCLCDHEGWLFGGTSNKRKKQLYVDLSGALSTTSLKIKKKSTLKKFLIFSQVFLYFVQKMFSYILAGELAKPEIQKILIFWEMELSSPKIKNFIFSPKSFFYISKTKTF